MSSEPGWLEPVGSRRAVVRLSTVKGAAVGASLVYLFDHEHGQERRRKLADTFVSLLRTMAGWRRSRSARGISNSPRPKRRITLLSRVGFFARRRRDTIQGPWELTTMNIDIDEALAMSGDGIPGATHRHLGKPVEEHRGFTRTPTEFHGFPEAKGPHKP
jgi:hypothetical protein